MKNYNNKSILNIDNAIFQSLAPKGSFLQHCLICSKWDDENEKSSSLAHYNLRLAISKLLQLIKADEEEHQALIHLLVRKPETITITDLIQGYKSVELALINSFPLSRAKSYSTAVRNFFNSFSAPIESGFNASELAYETLLSTTVDFKKNPNIDLFTVYVRNQTKFAVIDPDTFPNLFVNDSVLHNLLVNLENASKEAPFEYSVIAGLKKLIREIDQWPEYSEIKILLNSPLNLLTPNKINDALIDFEKCLHKALPNRKLNQLSTLFRQKLFDHGLTAPELNKAKDLFKTNFNSSGQLKFKPRFIIQCKNVEHIVDSFQLPLVLPLESVGENCFNQFEKISETSVADTDSVTDLIEILLLLQQGGYSDARLLLAKKPEDLITYNVSKGLIDLELLITKHFPDKKQEKLRLIRDFLNLCDIPTQSGKLLNDFEIDSTINVKEKVKTMAFQGYSKVNGKKSDVTVEFNLTKLTPLLKLNSVLVTALNNLQTYTKTTPMPAISLSDIERTLGYVVDTSLESAQVRHILISPLSDLEQRDFRLGFAQLEDIIDEQDIQLKAPRSQSLRTFLSNHAGKINGQIDIKNCGFKSRFSASDEMNAQKLIEPVDENGDALPSPILNQQQSLSELRKSVQAYFEKPINQILNACKKEVECYKQLVSTFNTYTEKDENGVHIKDTPEEVTVLVKDNQVDEGRLILKSQASSIRKEFTNEVVIGAYLRHQLSIGISGSIYCSQKSELIPTYVKHWFPNSSTGMRDFFWSGIFLPKNVLLVCFIRLVIRTTWNKDVIATLTRANLPEQMPEGSFVLAGFKEKVGKETTPVTIEPHEREIREVISFLIQHHDNMIRMDFQPDSIWDTPGSTKLNFLSAAIIDRLRDHYTLPYFRMELLAKHQMNLRKGIDGSLVNSQRERNHASSRVTSAYLTHPIAVIEYEANNADFQRKFETTVQFRHKETSIEKYGLDRNNIDEDLIVAPADHKEELPDWFILADGSSCTDIFAAVDKSKQDSICKGRKCHSGEGCEFNRVELGVDEFVRTLRHQAYYIARGEVLLAKHGREYFDEYIAPDMRFTFGLVKYVELSNPLMFKDAKGRLENEQ